VRQDIKAILVDVDDCLLPTNGELFSSFYTGLKSIKDRIHNANRKQIYDGLNLYPQIVFCSGRDRNYIEAVSFFCGLPNCYSIIESGIALFNPTTKELILNPVLTAETKLAFETIRKERLPQILKKFPGLFDYPGNIINIALERRYGSNTSIEECFKAIEAEVSDLVAQWLVAIHHSKIAVDISPASIDKASGIRFFAEKTGIDPDQMLGIGDSRGDFPMLKLAGYVGCPANASEECKKLIQEKKGMIADDEYAAGVAQIIARFLY